MVNTQKNTPHVYDYFQKALFELLKEVPLKKLGVDIDSPIMEFLSTELKEFYAGEMGADMLLGLQNKEGLHIDFQTEPDDSANSDMNRFGRYNLMLAHKHQRRIITLIIYSARVKKAKSELNTGSVLFRPKQIFLRDWNGNHKFSHLKMKYEQGAVLTQEDCVDLVLLPLMKNDLPEVEMAIQSMEIAKRAPSKQTQNLCQSAVYFMSGKYLDKANREKVRRMFEMTEAYRELFDEVEERVRLETEERVRLESALKFIEKGMDFQMVVENFQLTEHQHHKLLEKLSEQKH